MTIRSFSALFLVLMTTLYISCNSDDMEIPYAAKNPIHPQQGTRLRRLYTEWVTDDGLQLVQFDTGLWDEQLQIKCSFQLAEDGQMRCLPINNENALTIVGAVNAAGPLFYFLDAQCTKKFVFIATPSPSCMGSKVKYALLQGTPSSCSQVPSTTIFQTSMTPEPVTALYEIVTDGSGNTSCYSLSALTVKNIVSGKQALEVLNKIPATQFAAAQTGTYQLPQ